MQGGKQTNKRWGEGWPVKGGVRDEGEIYRHIIYITITAVVVFKIYM